MAYISKDKIRKIREEIKKQFPRKDGWKFSIRNDNHSTVMVSIMEAPVRFDDNDYSQINHYYPENYKNTEILKKLRSIANGNFLPENEQNFNKSDIMTDYFHVGWYVRLEQGQWDKPFKQVK